MGDKQTEYRIQLLSLYHCSKSPDGEKYQLLYQLFSNTAKHLLICTTDYIYKQHILSSIVLQYLIFSRYKNDFQYFFGP